MKKFMAVVLASLMAALLLAGCGSNAQKGYRILDETLADEEYVIGFKKGNESLRNAVMKALVELKQDGTLAEISTKWFGEDKIIVPDTYPETAATDDSLQKVKDAGKLVMGMDEAFPPMGFRDDNWEIVGFDVDVARAVCEKLGVELSPSPIDWKANVNMLNEGKVDCLWNGFTKTADREAALTLSEPYMVNRQVVVVMEDSDIQTLADLKDKSVVLQSGSSAVEALDSKPDVKASLKGGAPIMVDNNVLALNDLSKGGSDAVILDEVVARYYVNHEDQLAKVTE